ncbi:hypothetical protein [Methylocystis parvus]|uniref:Uncharacterized protein n=1 Tax=Methylocystis parvus TaxID=134 RepID=A0A6B8LZT6_9HYPH|nr:hypothetical protein [Methylocystis parvus]QGM96974.1 hypothetical protein F7D14_05445 [Methylocystis parvus]WBJ99138.1 hypothetical protein MMG94_14170 [Methylocystis parvus OBBP]
MIKLGELGRRHVAGMSALALTLLGLGYFASQGFPARSVAELPELAGPSLAQLNPNQSLEEKFLSSLRRVPPNAFGSAEALRMEEGQTGASAGADSSADASQIAPVSPASESKFWSDQEWRIADKAVGDFRSARKPQTRNTGTLSWRPPEEIANKIEKR